MTASPKSTTSSVHGGQRLESTNPYVFIVGSPRSGTTMLRRMINAHPQIQITRETHWVPRVYERRRGVDADGFVTGDIVEQLFKQRRFSQMKISRERLREFLADRERVHYSTLVTHVFDRYGKRKGKLLVGDKTPTYVRKLPTLFELWPQTRVVHLIRDGRDVWLSMRNWRMAHKAAGKFATWQIDPLVTTALWWKALVMMGRRDGARVGQDQYVEIEYSRLVAEPECCCRRLARYLGIPADARMQRYYEGRTKAEPNLSTNAAWLPPTPGRRDWRTEMDMADLERFEAAAGNLLDELYLPRTCYSIPASVARSVGEIKRQFAEEAASRWNLPPGW